MVAAFESSNLSAPAFARQWGIKYPTFAAWIAARKPGDSNLKRNNPPAFLIAEVSSDLGGAALEVRLPGCAVARAYAAFIRRHPELSIIPASCLTHIARRFKETRGGHPRIAASILLPVGMIYQVETRLDEQNAHPLDRQRARWLECRKPYDRLRKVVRRVIRFRGITPGSGFYKALHYAIGQLPHLEVCFLDGRIR